MSKRVIEGAFALTYRHNLGYADTSRLSLADLFDKGLEPGDEG